jgi:streptomycin 6-kinase
VTLLHGDLHHGNILFNGEKWVAIDPKGVIGEIDYEVGAFIRNPIPLLLEQHNPTDIIKNRIKCFSQELGLDQQRVTAWAFVQAVLAAHWSAENQEDWNCWIKVAEFIERLNLGL